MTGQEPDPVLEAMPESLVAALEVRDAWRARVAESQGLGLRFLVDDLVRWRPGSTVRVAFLGGDAELHGKIAEVTTQITDACNLELDFGFDAATGEFRRWTTADTEYAADIRVSFDRTGRWSLVGTDSTDPDISDPANGIGGGPGQRSLNLGAFDDELPNRWEGTVRHEFLHALAFHHEHQNMRGPCEDAFRWDDDAGYVPTRDDRGRFVPDAAGRRPGIYTYLAGPPNNWSRAKVDHSLRTVEAPNVVAGPFDSDSVMLYRFESFFYKTDPSPCAPTGNGIDLSDGDKRGLALLYPEAADALSDLAVRASSTADRIAAIDESPLRARALELLNEKAGAQA
jgi:hypothetical protein